MKVLISSPLMLPMVTETAQSHRDGRRKLRLLVPAPLLPFSIPNTVFAYGLCQLRAKSVIRPRFSLAIEVGCWEGKDSQALGDSKHSSHV